MAILGKFGSRFGHGVNGTTTEGLTERMAVGGKIHSNVDISRNNMFSRFMNDEKGFGGREHADKALAEIGHYKAARGSQKQGRKDLEAMQGSRASANEADAARLDTSIAAQKEANIAAASEKGLIGTGAGVAKHTFNAMNSGTAGQIAGKWGMVAGAGIVVNGTGRAATGGGATYNSSGQRDIMGIPLI